MSVENRLDYKEVFVPAGEFFRGTTEQDGDQLLRDGSAVMPVEKPQRKIYLDSFFIDVYPVTNEQYLTFVNQTGYMPQGIKGFGTWRDYYEPGKEKHPVVCVSLFDMMVYATWAGKHLPTEAEWEKASRGTDTRLWPWGNDFDPSRCNAKESKIGHTTPVDMFPDGKSPYGCFDMVGNVWEIVSDWFDVTHRGMENYYQTSPARNPQGPGSGIAHVMRGGAFSTLLGNCRCSFRICYDSSTQWDRVGFRLVKDV